MDTFSVASVSTLEITGNVDKISAETRQRAFQLFSSLRTLALGGSGTLDTLWVGVARARPRRHWSATVPGQCVARFSPRS